MKHQHKYLFPWVIGVAAVAACAQVPNQRSYRIDEPRLIAAFATPAEADPGEAVMLTAVFAAPSDDSPNLWRPTQWATCLAPKPPSEDNSVAPGCLQDEVVALGPASDDNRELIVSRVAATIPTDACARFGPDTPPGDLRPRSADASGGYYQPFRVERDTTRSLITGFANVRIRCNLALAPQPVAAQYRANYRKNVAPVAELSGDAEAIAITAPEQAREEYLLFDRQRSELVTRSETFRVQWYSTSGETTTDASFAPPGTNTVATVWLKPPTLPAQMWAVVSDDRGGQVVLTQTLNER